MQKRTHKLGGLGDVAAVLASAPSLNAAAKKLGVNRSTLHRWIESGKVPKPEPKRGDLSLPEEPPLSQSPAEWADSIRAEYKTLGRTDLQLLDLAVIALTQARDVAAAPRDRMSAIGRFQLVVRQLNLAEIPQEKPKPIENARPARARTGTNDPRVLLMAVK